MLSELWLWDIHLVNGALINSSINRLILLNYVCQSSFTYIFDIIVYVAKTMNFLWCFEIKTWREIATIIVCKAHKNVLATLNCTTGSSVLGSIFLASSTNALAMLSENIKRNKSMIETKNEIQVNYEQINV